MIRTVLGDIEPEQLGQCDFHEHFFRTYGPELSISNDFHLDNFELVIKEIQACLKHAKCSFVCMDPIGCGRDVLKMVKLATTFKGQANFILCTGFHKSQLYDPYYHWSQRLTFSKVVELLDLEIIEGIDEFGYCSPLINRLPYKAGIVKAGLSYNTITPFEVNALKLAANVSLDTNAPVSIHTEYGSMCLEAIDILKSEKIDLSKVVFCHMHRNLDIDYFKRILDNGANLCFDGFNRPKSFNEFSFMKVIEQLQNQGYMYQLLLSMDAGRKQYHKQILDKNVETKGIEYFFELANKYSFLQKEILNENPKKILNCF